jgi:hypothetical protein
MKSLAETQEANDRAAARELAELRADTVKGLRHALESGGMGGLTGLLEEAGVLSAIFDRFVDKRELRT